MGCRKSAATMASFKQPIFIPSLEPPDMHVDICIYAKRQHHLKPLYSMAFGPKLLQLLSQMLRDVYIYIYIHIYMSRFWGFRHRGTWGREKKNNVLQTFRSQASGRKGLGFRASGLMAFRVYGLRFWV